MKIYLICLNCAVIYLNLILPSWGQNVTVSSDLNGDGASQRHQSPTKQSINGEELDNQIDVPVNSQATIAEIKVRYIDSNNQQVSGKTKPAIILREFELQPGDTYDPKLAEAGLEGVKKLPSIKQASLDLKQSATDKKAVMIVTVEERGDFFFRFAQTLPPPTALKGLARSSTVVAMSNSANGISGGVRFGLLNLGGTNKVLSLGVEGGEDTLGFDLEYRDFWRHDRGYAVNVFSRQAVEAELDNGETEVNLPNDNDPWIDRLGGGVEFFFPLSQDFISAVGVSYQQISVRDGIFSNSLEPVDELGNRLSISDDGRDSLLTINFASALDRRNNTSNPTRGYRLLLGMDQSIPVGDASILYNRLSANYSQFVPLNLFGFTKGDRTLVLNVQGGTTIGDVPPYEAYSLGGSSTVRGFGGGELGSGRSFVQATTEYRFPIFDLNAFEQKFKVGGTLFVDYGSDLGSGDSVEGEPAVVRDKPGSGFGYGAGFRVPSNIGTFRLEYAFNSEGGNALLVNVGEQF